MHFSNETVQKAYLATGENPFDMEAWNVLLREMQSRKIDDVRPLFEKLVKVFPTTGRFWKMYIEQEMKARLYDKVEKVRPLFNTKTKRISISHSIKNLENVPN